MGRLIHSNRVIKTVKKPKPETHHEPKKGYGKVRHTLSAYEIETGIGERRANKKRKTRRRM